MPSVEGVIKKEKKKFFHFSNSVNLSVSYLLKGRGILLGEIFSLSAQEEKAEHIYVRAFLTTLSDYCHPQPNPTQPNLEDLQTSALRGPADFSSGPLPPLFAHWLVPEQELCHL